MKKELSQIEEYNEIFIDKDTAMEYITENSLLIVLDTHRPSMLPARQLTGRTAKVVVIDHHRRSMEFVSPCALTYLEAYASSTCEMVTELMDYMDMGKKLTRKEAECLYTGMLMDTKNFLIKTGARTFSAASYLRKLGINTLEVKKLFNISKSDYENKVDIVKTAVEIAPGFAVAEAKTAYPNIRVTASQAADEMLNIGDIGASIVIYPFEDGYGICARSIGNINVQLIMEALGGGGHATVAGAQIRTKDIERVRLEIDRAVRDYLHSRNN
jgi:c-di-AMP phosphodiesterase-like protein